MSDDKHFEVLFESLRRYDDIKDGNFNVFSFLKWATKSKDFNGEKIKDTEEPLKSELESVFGSLDKKYKSVKNNEYLLTRFIDRIKNENGKYSPVSQPAKETLKLLGIDYSGSNEKVEEFLKKLLPYSFYIEVCISLKSPYFSRDDDNFYLISNPILKDAAFKIPMVRGSGLKGALAGVGKKLVNESMSDYFESYVRVFGTGSEEYRELIDYIVNKNDNKSLSAKLFDFLLFRLGIRLTKDKIERIKSEPHDFLIKELSKRFENNLFENTPFLHPHRGRAIFYPVFFNNLSLEVINPHDRNKRAGTKPIYYEVVPSGEEGCLRIAYVPFDGISSKDILQQYEKDCEFLKKCVYGLSKSGIGAKTKLGWGQFEISNFDCKYLDKDGSIQQCPCKNE